MWLGESRGYLVDWATQRWVQATGRRTTLDRDPWLEGPRGKTTGIGTDFFDAYAAELGLHVGRSQPCGLLADFHVLRSSACDPRRAAPEVVAFYERTSQYEIDAWAEWCEGFRPFGWLLAVIFSRRLQQLNVPLSALDTSRGMASSVVTLTDPRSGERKFAAWVRQLVGTGHVIYAGAYSTCVPPGHEGRCVRVVFPLPNGNAIVIMRPAVHEDGSFSLVSSGDRFGHPGFYFTVYGRDGVMWARYLRSLRETIRVYPAHDGGIRADHVLSLWRLPFLRIHYRARRVGG
jgi:hypothetical protein